MVKGQHRTLLTVILSVGVLFAFTVLLEGNGYIIHKHAYDQGAQWTPQTLALDNTIKIGLYQLVIWTLLLIHRRFSLFAYMQTFWLTCTQDLIFYAVWNGGVFPAGDWTWMPLYTYFNGWTTTMQIALSTASLTGIALATVLHHKFLTRNNK
jgi:hypothetical protein